MANKYVVHVLNNKLKAAQKNKRTTKDFRSAMNLYRIVSHFKAYKLYLVLNNRLAKIAHVTQAANFRECVLFKAFFYMMCKHPTEVAHFRDAGVNYTIEEGYELSEFPDIQND